MIKKILFLLLSVYYIFALEVPGGYWRTSMFSTIGTVYATNAFGADESGATVAISDNIMMGRLDLKWIWQDDITQLGIFKLKLFKKVSFGSWANTDDPSANQNNVIDFNPVYRLEAKHFYIDYSLGVSLMSTPQIGGKDMGGAFAFNHITNIGVFLGNFYSSLGYSHYSNNGIYPLNPGINFYFFNFGYRYKTI